ncbi:hypothetical protein [Coleofasciculus sp. G3-WIS-01]|uniref:hypothetical protein n=1 Tax=Coleofasciculus sp. G3-WIS-01 TaxID=3069528 RepID=UPI004064C821
MKTVLANLLLIFLVELSLNGYGLKTLAGELDASKYNTAQQLTEYDNYNPQDLKEIQDLVKENVITGQQENIEELMNQIHPTSPQREFTRELMIFLFDIYDLRYEINSFDLIEISEDQVGFLPKVQENPDY